MKDDKIVIYQAKNGAIKLHKDLDKETIWATQKQIASVFDVDIKTINEHIGNIFNTNELEENSTIRKFQIVQIEGNRSIKRDVLHYNLDMIISIGYRVNSKKATQFRIWATKTLKQHIVKGYTINKDRIKYNYDKFLETVEDIKKLSNSKIENKDILELVKTFASTWFSLDAYDKQKFPKKFTKKKVKIEVDKLCEDIEKLKKELIKKKEATQLFAKESSKNRLEGIVGNILQQFSNKDLYPSIEEKASHLLYFIIKNHPFTDGNKRTAAFSFIWFLQKSKFSLSRISPETLTALTLLIAESNPKDKDRVIGLVLLLIKK